MDIFISYARGDREQVSKLASALQAEGLSVWWDHNLLAGDDYEALIDAQIKDARAVIVVWSDKSTGSHWVRSEADAGLQARKLLPLQFSKTRIPRPFDRLHTLDLSDWRDESRDSIKPLIDSAHAIARGEPPRLADHKLPKRRLISVGALASAALVAAAIIGNLSGIMGWGVEGKGDAELTKRFETIDAKLDGMSDTEPTIDQAVVRKVLRELSLSGQPADDAVYALMRTGNLYSAIEILENRYDALPLDAEAKTRIDLLHQTAALSQTTSRKKATALYETILDYASDDQVALARLARLNQPIKVSASPQSGTLDNLAESISVRTEIEMRLTRGFGLMQSENYEEAARLFEQLAEKTDHSDLHDIHAKIISHWIHAERATGSLDTEKAITRLNKAINIQGNLNLTENLSQSLTTLGALHLENGNPEDAFLVFSDALEHSSKSKNPMTIIGLSLNVANAALQSGRTGEAKTYYLHSLRLAREEEIDAWIYASLTGLADVAEAQGVPFETCAYKRRAAKIIRTEGTSDGTMSPTNERSCLMIANSTQTQH